MMGKILTRLVIPAIVLAGGAVGARFLFLVAPEAAEVEVASTAVPVAVRQVRPTTAEATVVGTGLVIPAKSMVVTPEISGRVVYRSEALVPGGRVREGDPLVRLDGRDYALALRVEQSRVVAAELDLRTERARGDVARREWDLLGASGREEQVELALRRPHLAARQASLEAARSAVQRAKLNLSRTTIRAPWNAIVAERGVEEGQVVSPGTKIARLIASDQMWVRISVPLHELSSLSIPGVNGEEGSPARVIHELGPGRQVVREGRVLRLESELDAQTRMAQLLVAVDDPLDEPEGAVPLLPGSYVTVELRGRRLEGVFEVPRAALRGGDTVWIAGAGDRLERRRVEVRSGTSDVVWVTGLQDGDRVVTTNLSLPVAGALVSVQESSPPVAAAEGGPSDG